MSLGDTLWFGDFSKEPDSSRTLMRTSGPGSSWHVDNVELKELNEFQRKLDSVLPGVPVKWLLVNLKEIIGNLNEILNLEAFSTAEFTSIKDSQSCITISVFPHIFCVWCVCLNMVAKMLGEQNSPIIFCYLPKKKQTTKQEIASRL